MTVEGRAPGTEADGGALLDVRGLQVEFRTRDGIAHAVNGVSYTVAAGETLAVLGESGSGKSVTAQAVLGILDTPPGHVTGGEILFHGRDLLRMGAEERRRIRGTKLAMIFQDALSALNPVLSVGAQLGEMFEVHRGASRKEARDRAAELMDRVRIPAARSRVGDYPHQFSGGMRQRIMIAMALALEPDLIIADEPTTALDVTVRHVRGPDRGESPRPRPLPGAGPPVHPRSAGLHPAPGPEGPGTVRDQGPAAQPDRDPAGLPLPPALPQGAGHLPYGPAAALRRGAGPGQRVPLLGGDRR